MKLLYLLIPYLIIVFSFSIMTIRGKKKSKLVIDLLSFLSFIICLFVIGWDMIQIYWINILAIVTAIFFGVVIGKILQKNQTKL